MDLASLYVSVLYSRKTTTKKKTPKRFWWNRVSVGRVLVELNQCHGGSNAAPCKNLFKHAFAVCSIGEWASMLKFDINLKLCSMGTARLRYSFIYAYIYHFRNSVICPSLIVIREALENCWYLTRLLMGNVGYVALMSLFHRINNLHIVWKESFIDKDKLLFSVQQNNYWK